MNLKVTALIFIGVSFFSCKKDKIETPVVEKYTQYFNANINGKPLSITGSMGENRNIFSGSWTGIGYNDGSQKEMYRVDVSIPNPVLNSTSNARLSFQIFNIQPKLYAISSAKSYRESFSTGIYLVSDLNLNSSKVYTTNEVKKAFQIDITKYERPKDGTLPIVGGKINGTLYNTDNLQDSIVIKDGVFEVRY